MNQIDPPDVQGEPGSEFVTVIILGALAVGILLGIYF